MLRGVAVEPQAPAPFEKLGQLRRPAAEVGPLAGWQWQKEVGTAIIHDDTRMVAEARVVWTDPGYPDELGGSHLPVLEIVRGIEARILHGSNPHRPSIVLPCSCPTIFTKASAALTPSCMPRYSSMIA